MAPNNQELLAPNTLVYTDYDTTIREMPVKIGTVDYVLKEADGFAASKYQTAAIKGSRFSQATREITIGEIGDAELVLLSGCLYYKESGKLVPEGILRKWPHRILKDLSRKAKELSGLNDAEDSADAIKEEIARLQKRLEEIEQDALGNSSGENKDGSDSPTN